MDEKLILNNGTEIHGHFLESEERLFLYMYDIAFEEAFNLLIVSDNTKIIKQERYGQEQTVRGYKHLYSITEEVNGISAALKKR